ncbi:eukaryotic translation initiation factor subunit eIF2B-gamma, putative [Paecilomyces variotii No. 5]|uniref:Translation initiation factor eIF2B subunit gamma n=1 Tax=Byssochlamys spectabilis (strain No. 5 / NBRC 109023) TaxID=1356009 RepID=V5FIR2_BYSSN|nr:eukaryotic translation initiation factor subunit eIF2B-gamma, putative [Paecilomyces variotii No. 5]
MPHPVTVPPTGFQALILCGPGVSLNTFTSNPEEFPKALVPIANRPMVWYPLDWCYRMGITNITLITPPQSQPPLEAALSQNPHLTSLPSPSPSVLAPADLTLTTGTAELLRLPEVQACIKSDFVLLPCDLICDIPGESLLEAWMVAEGALGGGAGRDHRNTRELKVAGMGGEKGGRRGGLGVWYQTKDREESVKGEVTDFVATAPLEPDEAPVVYPPTDGPVSIRFGLSKLVLAMPMDSLKEKMEDNKGLLLRHSLIKRNAQVKMLTTYRDAHIYVFPYWVKEMARSNERFESVSEDLVGWWAKAEWQKGLADKLGFREILEGKDDGTGESGSHDDDSHEEEIDLQAMTTTKAGSRPPIGQLGVQEPHDELRFASRVNSSIDATPNSSDKGDLVVPPILAYVHPSQPSAPLIRRVDNSALLLSVSLRLAKLESIEEVGRTAASPFAHSQKIAYPAGVAQRCTVTKGDCLLAENVTVEEKCVIKESVIGANCHIASGARLTRCLIMDGAVVGERCQLTGCVVGRRSKIGRESVLKDCEIQDGNIVPDETDAKNEKFMVFQGLEDGDEDMSTTEDFDEDGGDLGF